MTDIEIVQSILNQITGDSTNLILFPKSRDYSELTGLEENHIIVSSLSQLCELPLRIRRMMYSEKLGQNESAVYGMDRIIKDILSISTDILSKDIGREKSKKWRDNLFGKIRQIIAGEGPFGILNGSNAIIDVVEVPNEDRIKIIQEMKFLFPHGPKIIAQRDIEIGEGVGLMERWNVNESFEELFLVLEKLDSLSVITTSSRMQHIFLWSDMPLVSYQSSFLKRIFSDYIYHFSTNSHNDAAVILLVSTSTNIKTLEKPNFNPREYLALTRALSGGRMYLCPGANEEVFTDPVQRLNRPHSVLESETYFNDVENRIKNLDLINLRLMKEVNYVVSEATHDLVKHSSIAIMSNCWKGTWTESREVDGEQVI